MMTEKPEAATAAAGRTNSVHPEPAAAAEPCACGDRIDTLEGRMSAYEGVNRALSYLMLAAAAAIFYIVWTSASPGGGGDKK